MSLGFSDLPPEIYDIVVGSYGDMVEITSRRMLSREAYRRYMDSIEWFYRDFEVLAYLLNHEPLDTIAVGDWFTINRDLVLGSGEWIDPSIVSLVKVLSDGLYEDLSSILGVNEVEVVENMRSTLDRLMGFRTGPNRLDPSISEEAIDYLRDLLKNDYLTKEVLIPWSSVMNNGSLLLRSLAFMNWQGLYHEVSDVLSFHGLLPDEPVTFSGFGERS